MATPVTATPTRNQTPSEDLTVPMRVNPGKYYGKIVSHKLAEAKSSGNVQLQFVMEVMGGYDPANPEQLTGEGAGLTATVFRAITEKTVQRVYAELDKLGYTEDGFSKLDPTLAGEAFVDLSGQEVWLTCSENSYQGNTNERWEFAILGGGGIDTVTPEAKKARQVDTLFSRAKAGVAAAPKTAGGTSGKPAAPARKPAPAAAAAGAGESEIPY